METTTTETLPTPQAGVARHLPIGMIVTSKTNPRRHLDKAALDELTDSVRRHGILQPLLVRPFGDVDDSEHELFELVAGHRRLEAARAAEISHAPVLVRILTDTEVLEIQLVENLQRADLHPLEEAEGYRQLTAVAKYDVARIAARVGRSIQYVYDRLKLLHLTDEAKEHFLEDRITAGHAILLARLTPKDQTRAMDVEGGGLFQAEALLWSPEDEGRSKAFKHRSVRELQAWIDQHVRFDAKEPDPMLFPETAAALVEAKKVVLITFDHYIRPDARDGKTFGPRSWKRADGERGSKPCEHSVLGCVAVGPGRGDSFPVCVNKARCPVHWVKEIRKNARRSKATSAERGAGGTTKAASQEEKLRDKALQEARIKSAEATTMAVLELAGKMSAEKVLRCLAHADRWAVYEYLRDTKSTKAGSASNSKGFREWADMAPVAEIQRALAHAHCDSSEGAEAFGVDEAAIVKRFEDEALAALKSAAPPRTAAKPKRTTSGKKPKGAPAQKKAKASKQSKSK